MPRKSFPSSAEKIESVFQFWYCIFIHFKPYALYGKHPVGVDVLIDPSAKRPDGRRAARRSAPTGAVGICRGRCPHRPVREAATDFECRGALYMRPCQGAFCRRLAGSTAASGGYLIRPYKVRCTIPKFPGVLRGFSAPGAPEWRRPKTRPWTCSARRRRCLP